MSGKTADFSDDNGLHPDLHADLKRPDVPIAVRFFRDLNDFFSSAREPTKTAVDAFLTQETWQRQVLQQHESAILEEMSITLGESPFDYEYSVCSPLPRPEVQSVSARVVSDRLVLVHLDALYAGAHIAHWDSSREEEHITDHQSDVSATVELVVRSADHVVESLSLRDLTVNLDR